MATSGFYAPAGIVQTTQNNFWTVDAKLPLPIEGPIYDLAGLLLKPTLKRPNPNGPINLEIELISSVNPQTLVQVGFTVETSNPPNEKTFVHSNQQRSAILSDRNRVIEVKTMVMADRWEVAKGLRVHFMFNPIQNPKPHYACFWNEDSSKNVEIRFTDPQVPPVLAHKGFVLENCPKIMTLVRVFDPNKDSADDGGGASLASDQVSTRDDLPSPRPGSNTPASISALSTPRLTPLSAAAHEKNSPTVQEADPLLSLEDRSDITSLHSLAGSYVDIRRDRSFSSSKDNLSLSGSEREAAMRRNSEDAFLIEESDSDECRPLLSQDLARDGNGGQHQQLQSGGKGTGLDQQRDKKPLNRKMTKLSRHANSNVALLGTASLVDTKRSSNDVDQQGRDMERDMEHFNQEQESKRQASQQDRENTPLSPLSHNIPDSKTASPGPQQQQKRQQLTISTQLAPANKQGLSPNSQREIWHWTNALHPDVCAILLRWLYLEQIPVCPSGDGHGGGVFEFYVSEVLLRTFVAVDQPILFQRFLTSQLNLISQHKDLMTLWKAPELAQQGTMVNQFFRPILVQASSDNLHKILGSQAFFNIFTPSDPSGIFREVFARQNPRRQ
ncbi:hypothetical protein BGW39_001574 [Mortierella sp. 14UC]|nr:hypothetical protein BGW39_001574 [Mortierella sp. 14UC]